MRHYIYFSNEQDKENVTPELRCLVKAAICAALSYEDFRKSAEISVTFTDNDGIQVAFLTVHSVLHLLGYDHLTSEEADRDMRARQDAVLDMMGIKR